MAEVDNAVRELVLDATGLRPLGLGASLVWQYLHDQEHTEIFSGGSAGPGKTFNGCLFDITEALRLRGSKGLMFRSTAENLRKSTIPTYFEVCEKARLVEGLDYAFNESKGLLKWIGGSVTDFDYLTYVAKDPNYSRLGGRQYTRAVGDEIDEVEERGVDVLAGRIRYRLTHYCHHCAALEMAVKSRVLDRDEEEGDPILWECYACGIWTKGVLPKLLGTGNPGDYWTKYRFVAKKKDNELRRRIVIGRDAQGQENCWAIDQRDLQPHQACVLMLLSDNPDKGFVTTTRRQLESNPEDFDQQRLLYGNWNAVRKTGREFLPAFNTKDHVRKVPYDPEQPIHITFDFNTAPYLTLLVAQLKMDDTGRWHVAFLQELCPKHPEATTENACRMLVREMREGRYKGHSRGLFFYGDHSGKNMDPNARDGIYHQYDTVEKELRPWYSNNWDRVLRNNPSHVVVRDFCNSMLKGERKHYVTFDPGMTNTISDLLNVKEAADGTILKVYETDHVTGVRFQKNSHCLQAFYYLTVSAFADEYAHFVRK